MFVRKQWLTGCRVARNAPIVSHMLFADDSYIFCKVNEMEVASILRLLAIYERASRQKINFEKSSVFFSNNVQQNDRTYLCGLLGMAPASENSSNLGLPCTMGRSKNAILGFLKDKMIKKIQSWETRFLSKAGKEVLIKSVAQSLPSYAMNGWRLFTNENSLVAQVYKARYFPKGNFLQAELGSNPSFIWRSILEAKDLIKIGVVRTIGDGKTTSVLEDPWLPTVDNSFITTYHPSLVGRIVDCVFKIGSRKWDVELIRDERSGGYTANNAYKLLQVVNGDWLINDGASFWKKVWQLNVPAKVQHLVWCVLAGCLPTKLQLNTKYVHVDLTCPMCNTEPESITHVLFRCNFARSCWNLSSADVHDGDVTDVCSWFCNILVQKPKVVAEEATMILWRIWMARNDLLWSNKSTKVSEVIRSAKTSLDNWKNARSNGSLPLLNVSFGSGKEHWTKPVSTKFKINVDGALFETENRFGFGFIVRDKHGNFEEAYSNSKIGLVAPEIAEAVGVKEVFSWIKTNHLTDVEVETDSLVVVQAIKGSVQMPSQFGFLVQDCRFLLSELHNVFISFVKRSANRAAHCIARKSCFMSGCILDELSAPPDLLSIVREDNFSC
uniref:Reverse transcriptase n=1 Tax=Cannabis sativa TaxID=3483 RepID=A0A803Q666_CANSA